jgi:hypothetical protein
MALDSTLLGEWMSSPSAVVQLAAGVILLLFGRRLFWLLVAAIGFFVGLGLADAYLSVDAEALRWTLGIVAGVVAALAMVFVQRFAISAAGALAAGYSTYWYLSLSWDPLEFWAWGLVAGAAVVGLLIARTVFGFGLIFVSALSGATLILEGAGSEAATSRWLFLVLVVVGTAVQASWRPRKSEKK